MAPCAEARFRGTLTLSRPSTYSGPTTIEAGTLEADDYVNYSPVTIDSGATLTGDGGTGAVTNLGGTYDATLYMVTITNSNLQDGDGNAPFRVTVSYAPGENGLVLGPSASDAANRVPQVTDSTDMFGDNPSYTLDSYGGQAFVDLAARSAEKVSGTVFFGTWSEKTVPDTLFDP